MTLAVTTSRKELVRRLAEAEATIAALLSGEIDAVVDEHTRTPLLLSRAQDALRESEALLEEAQAIAHVGSWTSPQGSNGEIAWSTECYRIFGVPLGVPVTVASFLARVHPEDRPRVEEASRAAWGDGAPYDVTHRLTRPDGSERWVRERAVVERDGEGRPIRMVGTVQDVTDHHLAVEALRESEAELRLLAEAMPQIVWITRPDGANVYFNRQWTEYTGLSLEESLGDGWNKPFHPEDAPRAALAWRRAMATSGAYSLECRLRRADGVYLWWLIRGVAVRDGKGDILKWFGTCTDIDALKHAEERLRVLYDVAEAMRAAVDPSETLRATLGVLGRHLRASRCAYAIVDPDGEHCDVQPDYVDHCASLEGRVRVADFGSRLVADAARDGAAVVVRDVESELSSEDAGALRAGGVEAFICCSRSQQGALRALIAVHQASPRDWTPDEISLVQEVADQCWAALARSTIEAKLRESEALLRIAGRTARLGGWSVSLSDLRVTWSDEVCAIHEVPLGTVPTVEEAIAFCAPEFRVALGARFDACLREGTPFDQELQIVTGTRRRVWVRMIADAQRSLSGEVTSLRGAIQDVDERRKLQDQFRQAQKMEAVGRLAGGVAHDFNNLLSVVLSYSELALDDLKPGDPLREDIEQILSACHRGTGLTRQLLAFSRQQVLDPRVIDLNEVVHGMKAMLGRLLGADIDLTVLALHPTGRVVADPAQVEQVVMNLAVNARDAMPQGGKLTIETSSVRVDAQHAGKPAEVAAGAFVVLAVTDTGEGMTEETRLRAFEPFFTTKEKGKGTGLGLATVFGIAQQSGGYVTVYSEPGHGTTFRIYFPQTDRPRAEALSDAPSGVLDGTETILLVEDEDQLRAVACAILRRHGYNVLETSNGGEAFLVSADFSARIDLLLTDVVMPRMSGRRLAEQLAPQRPLMKVLFVSGYTDDAILQHGVLNSGVAFLQKPFNSRELLRKVRDVLDGARAS